MSEDQRGFLKIYLRCMRVCLSVCVCVYHMCLGVWNSEEGAGSPGTEGTGGCKLPRVCQEPTRAGSSLSEQPVLLTDELSLQLSFPFQSRVI